MYGARSLAGTEGPEPFPLTPGVRVTIANGAELHRLIRSCGFRRSLEIGFAYGFSTIWLLDALSAQAGAHHVAVDPFQRSQWHGVGLHQVGRLGQKAKSFTFIEKHAVLGLPPLIAQQERFDFIFIDGNHRFDDVLVDF
jgi:predicted O-methyltransferase YrrM